MKVVMAPIGTRGDIQPLLALAIELKAAGHHVSFCAAPDYPAWVEGLGMAFYAAGPPFEALLREKADNLIKHPVEMVRSFKDDLAAIMEAQLTVVREEARDADVLIGAGFQIVGSSVAESIGVPYQFIAYCPILLPTAVYPSFLIRRRQLPMWANRLSWRVIRWVFDWMFKAPLNSHRIRLGLPPLQEVYAHNLAACEQVLLAWDREICPVPTDVPCAVHQTGAWILHSHQDILPEALEQFLQAGPAPVYLGFGSMTDSNPEQTTQLVIDAVQRVGCRAVVSRGWAGLGGKSLPENILAIDSVPHTLLFPRMAAIVHHGGAGTTSAAVRSGAPQVIVPHLGDQFFIGHRLREAGLAPAPILRTQLTVARLEAALRACLTDEGLKTRARAVGQKLAGANGVRDGVRHLERLVAGKSRP